MSATIETRLREAIAAFDGGDLAGAALRCAALLSVAPANAHAHTLDGDLKAARGEFAAAAAAYEQAARLFPGLGAPFSRAAMLRFRAAHGPPPRPRAARAGHPRVQMRALGLMGRFGNQLLQYAFARLYAERYRLELEVPDWLGRDLYGFDDPLPGPPLPTVNEQQVDLYAALRGSVALAGHDIRGYLCGDTGQWGDVADDFRALFRYRPAIAEPLERAHARARGDARSLVAVHLRRGDFGVGRFWAAPVRWYLEWLETVWSGLDRPALYLATDAAELAGDFARFAPLTARDLGVEFAGAPFLVDHYLLTRADCLAISNSTFSVSAAMLNGSARSFVRPDPVQRRLVPFAPWQTSVLIDAPRDPGALTAAERALIDSTAFAGDQTIVHIGPVCTPWVTELRARWPLARVLELESVAELAAAVTGLGARRVDHLRVESAGLLGALLDGATSSLQAGVVRAIHLRARGDERVGPQVGRLLELGFALSQVGPDGVTPVPSGRLRPPGTYVAHWTGAGAQRPAAVL